MQEDEYMTIPVEDLDVLPRVLGQGGFGSVFLAKWHGAGGGQIVALKEVHPVH